MTSFELRSSREFWRLQVTVIAITTLFVALHQADLIWLLLALLILICGFILFARATWFPSKKVQIKAIIWNEQGWSLQWRDDSECAIELRSGCVATPYFIVLSWGADKLRKNGQTLVWRDALSETDFRHLSRLYWAEKIASPQNLKATK